MRKKYIPTHAGRKFKISGKKVIISTIAVVLSLCVLMIGMLVAKYRDEKSSDGIVRAYNFYFTSNLLDGKKHTLAPGSTSVKFMLGNHEDDLRYSEVDIKYTVEVDKEGATVTKNQAGILKKDDIQDAEVTIEFSQPGTYTVTAVGEGGYSKTLTATIVVPEKEAQLYYDKDTSAGEYMLLTVWNEGDKNGEVTIRYNAGIPDNTNPNMTDWKTEDGSQTVTIEPHESKVFRFFDVVDIADITVEGATAKRL